MERTRLNDIYNTLFWLLGVVSTTTIFQISILGQSMTLFNFVLYIIVGSYFILSLFKKKIKIDILFSTYCVLVLVSLVVNMVDSIGSAWSAVSIKNTINYMIFYMCLLTIIKTEALCRFKEKFISGIKTSIAMQLIWEIGQIIFWYGFKLSLNEVVFRSFMEDAMVSLSQYDIEGTFRFTGLGWQASNLAMALVLGVILFESKYIKILCALGIVVSTSRVGIVTLLVVVLWNIFLNKKNRVPFFQKLKKMSFSLSDVVISLILFVLLIYFLNQEDIRQGLFSTFEKTTGRLQSAGEDIHLLYYLWVPEIMKQCGIMHCLFGYGLGCSGYAYSRYKHIYVNSAPWIPENDYVSSLFGVGVVGTLVLFIWYIKKIIDRRKYKMDTMILCIVAIAGFFYAYFNSWVLVLIFFCMNGEEIEFKHEKNFI